MGIERLPNESELAYHKRLVYGKLIDKTLADVDYSELAEPVYGQDYSSDTTRKMLYGSCRTLQLLDELSMDSLPSGTLQEIELARAELMKERQRFFDQRREYKKLLSADGRREHLYEALEKSAERLSETIGRVYEEVPALPYPVSDNEAILVLSDWHYGMVASNIFNRYDTSICRERVKAVFAKTAERIRVHGCNKLHVVVLGDLVHGAIHTGTRVASEELVCDQIMQVAEILAQSIENLSFLVDELVMYFTYGNHARTVQNKHDNIHRDNMERLIPWWIRERLHEYENVRVAEEDETEFILVEAAGHHICAAHGDLDSIRQSTRLLPTLFAKKRGLDLEYIVLGDKHHRESFDELGVTSSMCGSLCGTDEYANGKRAYAEPSQLLLIVNPSCGVDAEYRLRCG